MKDWTAHLIVAPILVPLVAGAAILLLDEARRTMKSAIAITATDCQ